MKKLRLLLTDVCHKKCDGCCNKDFKLDELEVVKSFKEFEVIMITGGEPMLYPEAVIDLIDQIREENKTAKLILYTTKLVEVIECDLDYELDGLTITLHDQKDADKFVQTERAIVLNSKCVARLNIFKGITIPQLRNKWIIKDNIEWIKNCPLPEGEVFMRLKPA